MIQNKRTLTEAETAAYIGLSRSTLRQARMNGQRERRCPTPPYVRMGRRVVYLIDDLDLFLEQRRSKAGTTGGSI